MLRRALCYRAEFGGAEYTTQEEIARLQAQPPWLTLHIEAADLEYIPTYVELRKNMKTIAIRCDSIGLQAMRKICIRWCNSEMLDEGNGD
jgi:hypothetical protein